MAGKIELILTTEFKEAYKKLPQDIKKKVKKQLRYLQENPAHPSLQIHKLNDEWEFYVDIFYRCFFLREANRFTLLTMGTHRLVERYKKK
jgi:mRNA-degrading endonuclease YafQ of YafQ-DinJ toxin-antitoxin module